MRDDVPMRIPGGSAGPEGERGTTRRNAAAPGPMASPWPLCEATGAEALRGDDALARAAREVAAPRRRLLAALRDAHAETGARIEALPRAAAALEGPPRPAHDLLARLQREAAEQFHRIELVIAQLRERPGGGVALDTGSDLAAIAARCAARRDAALLCVLAEEERRGAQEALALRNLAHLAGQHLASRLLDLTVQERLEASHDLTLLAQMPSAVPVAPPPARRPVRH